MKCKNVSHLLDAFADGEVSERLRAKIQDHLGTCSACSQELQDIKGMSTAFAAAPPGEYLRDRAFRAAQASSRLTKAPKMNSKLRYGIATLTATALLMGVVMSMPNSAEAAFKKIQDATGRVKTSKVFVLWKEANGKTGHKTVWADAKRVREEYWNGEVKIFDGEVSFGYGSTVPGAEAEFMGSFDPNMHQVSTQLRMLARDKEPIHLGAATVDGRSAEALAIPRPDNMRLRLIYDPRTNLPLKMVEEQQSKRGWVWVSEIRYQFNVPVTDSMFTRPPSKP
jgi:hypothetical protein